VHDSEYPSHRCNVCEIARKAAFILTILCFAALAAGLTLKLHLLSHEHPEEHDFDHCSICQQLLITPAKFIPEPELSLPDVDLHSGNIEFVLRFYVTAVCCTPFDPRPPPLL